MSTNSLLASLYGSSNQALTQRSSSLFTKHLSFVSGGNQVVKCRPASVSKIIQRSSSNELVRWTPLIKTVHKLGAKLKKQYFFFWCRMEAHVKARNKLKQTHIKNQISLSNQATKVNQSQQKDQNINQDKENITQSKENSANKISSCLSANQDLQKVISSIILPIEENSQLNQQNINFQTVQVFKQVKKMENNVQNQLLKQSAEQIHLKKQTKISDFVIILSKLQYKYVQTQIKNHSFKRILSYCYKLKGMQKIVQIGFKSYNKRLLLSVLRTVKKYSHRIMKTQILVSSLNTGIKKVKAEAFKLLVLKNAQKKHNQEQQTKEKMFQLKKIQNQNEQLRKKQENKQKITQIIKQNRSQRKINNTEKVGNTVLKFLKTDPLPLTQTKKQIQEHFIQKLNASKVLNMNCFRPTKVLPKLKQDTTLGRNFKFGNSSQRMRKLNRLYPEEPFFQIPDISDITLFNSAINNNLVFVRKQTFEGQKAQVTKMSKKNQEKSQNECIVQEQTQDFNQLKLQISPRFQENDLQDVNSPSNQLSKRSSSHKKIILVTQPSSRQIKNILNTPISGKKTIQLFSRKKSVEYIYKNTSKNYQTSIPTSKSTVLRKFDLFSEVKEKQNQIGNKKINQLSSKQKRHPESKQKRHPESNLNGRKASKEVSQHRYFSMAQTKTQQPSQKQSLRALQYKENHVPAFSKINQNQPNSTSKRQVRTQKKQVNTPCKKQGKQNYPFQSSQKKVIKKNRSAKENNLSQFNSVSSKIISYNQFMMHCPQQKLIQKPALNQVYQRQPTFQKILMTERNQTPRYKGRYDFSNAQPTRQACQINKSNSKKLRSKIDKLQMNTARKMKLQIQNMINQRKKSSIGLLKF